MVETVTSGDVVTIRSDRAVALYDGRNQAQNGWFVLRSELPAGKVGTVLSWTVEANSVPGWVRPPSIGHSQLGYAPDQSKIATIEVDRNDARRPDIRLLRIDASGEEKVVKAGKPDDWGNYLRYHYLRFDFSDVTEPGLYTLGYGDIRTAPFRIAADLYADAWHPQLPWLEEQQKLKHEMAELSSLAQRHEASLKKEQTKKDGGYWRKLRHYQKTGTKSPSKKELR